MENKMNIGLTDEAKERILQEVKLFAEDNAKYPSLMMIYPPKGNGKSNSQGNIFGELIEAHYKQRIAQKTVEPIVQFNMDHPSEDSKKTIRLN